MTDIRLQVLRQFGADSAVAEELVVYNADSFNAKPLELLPHFPLADEEFVADWETHAEAVKNGSSIYSLSDRLVQLSFPIEAGISESADYVAATRRGAPVHSLATATGLKLERVAECRIELHSTWAGRIPLILPAGRADFVALVRAFSHRNEPVAIPPSMGACIVSAYNNWSRFGKLREQWVKENPNERFTIQAVSNNKAGYQDRFIILSDSWYSGVLPSDVGMDDQTWRSASVVIRREHESAHYWTRRVFQSMRNSIFDELIADYCGILAAIGRYRGDWHLRFLGIEDYPNYREGGRLQNYRGPLSNAAFAILQRLVFAAVNNLHDFSARNAEQLQSDAGILLALVTLSNFTLEQLASPQASDSLTEALTTFLEKLYPRPMLTMASTIGER